jgi:hypothetical protein
MLVERCARDGCCSTGENLESMARAAGVGWR